MWAYLVLTNENFDKVCQSQPMNISMLSVFASYISQLHSFVHKHIGSLYVLHGFTFYHNMLSLSASGSFICSQIYLT